MVLDTAGQSVTGDEPGARVTELEERLRQLTADLETANRELEAFSYSVSHDLRTPVRAIEGFTRMLVEDHAAQLDGEGRRLLEVVRTSTVRMGQLIDDLLTLSRATRHPLVLEDIPMEIVVRTAFGEVTRDVPGDQVPELRLDELPLARGDLTLMRQVWSHLLSNAVKFSAPRQEPRIMVSARREVGAVVYTVRDNGVGFDMRYAGKLFQLFQRLHSLRDFEGTGLGLALVRRIVERHGGRVSGTSEPGEGAVFSFCLPDPG